MFLNQKKDKNRSGKLHSAQEGESRADGAEGSLDSAGLNESLYSIEGEEEDDVDLIYETRVSNSLFSQLVAAEYCTLFFAMIGLLLSVVNHEIRLNDKNEDRYRLGLIYNCLCTICLLISVTMRYELSLRWSITVQRYTAYDNLINTGIWR
jgi:hypothetical protein